MGSIGLLPAIAILAGAACGALVESTTGAPRWVLGPFAAVAWTAWLRGCARLMIGMLCAGFFGAGLVLAAEARASALRTPLRAVLDRKFGSFEIDTLGPGGRHDPVAVRALLVEDASIADDITRLRADVRAVELRGRWLEARGGVALNVNGVVSREQASQWRAGRAVEMAATFRRPTGYLNAGVPDFERDLALDGTTLLGSVKSGLLVEVRSHGSLVAEVAAAIRAHIRRSLERRVGPHDPVSAAIATAVLVGDRTGLPDDVRLRLQAAGTYHVIAISGGNIAILAGLTLLLLLAGGVTGRPAALATIVALAAYAEIVTGGASVWRATVMAILYLSATVLDHRSPPWHAMAMAAAVVVCLRPLDVRDVGFILTFGATAALLAGARQARVLTSRYRPITWLIASVVASLAVEIVLLPVAAWTFLRVTIAGLVLNLIAVPLMGVVQIAGMVVSAFDSLESIARPAGWVAHIAASSLVSSARLVDVAPWLSARVPPPPVALVVVYYAALGATFAAWRPVRAAGLSILAVSMLFIAAGLPVRGRLAPEPEPRLRLTVFDVGQGDASLLQLPDRSSLLVDAGGIPFGRGGFDIGARVLAPALWARGLRSLETLLVTHGDPDHIGGARSVVGDFEPTRLWEGVPVSRHAALQDLLLYARERGARAGQLHRGDELHQGGVRLRVLHPPAPDWERQRVRNDDSVMIEVMYGDVAMLLTGDVSAASERTLAPLLAPARVRLLKVAHHGSRTSTSRELLEHWRPHIAIISCGRGNTFGHPAPDVIERLQSVGATILRTDLHGQVTVDTDGSRVEVTTYLGGIDMNMVMTRS